jgi:hypothetical protein
MLTAPSSAQMCAEHTVRRRRCARAPGGDPSPRPTVDTGNALCQRANASPRQPAKVIKLIATRLGEP